VTECHRYETVEQFAWLSVKIEKILMAENNNQFIKIKLVILHLSFPVVFCNTMVFLALILLYVKVCLWGGVEFVEIT
jgi:uncharacterized membrane protein YagU involved in acid resistance